MDRKLFSKYFYNQISAIGAGLAILMLVCELILFGMDITSDYSNVYHGLFIYLILPPFLILGLLLIPIGALVEHRRIRLGIAKIEKPALVVDFSKPAHRNAVIVFVSGTVIVMVMTAVGTYKAFHYTESVAFCGTTCHKVMKPEHTTYKSSPHARVKCVECHIGAGAGWYVHSKLSGVRQVLNTIKENYPRPIPVPVQNLRPAKETCEECHWPGKLFGAVERDRTYFASDPGDVPSWRIRLLMHVSSHGTKNAGIHAHMFMNNKIYYVADDEKRSNISWVKQVDAAGVETVYATKNSPYANITPPAEKIREMDCLDCHSRPSHSFEAPIPLVDRAMVDGRINSNIPKIKSKAVAALAKTYATEKQAVDEIRTSLLKYYIEKQSAYYKAHEKEVKDAIEEVVRIFKGSFFPEMKARWDAYPDNIGHLISPGCFRCHDDQHKAPSGQVITRDCYSCHSIIGQGPSDKMQQDINGLPFEHPFFENDAWKETNCSDCHSGS